MKRIIEVIKKAWRSMLTAFGYPVPPIDPPGGGNPK